jgi:hypothetical protein
MFHLWLVPADTKAEEILDLNRWNLVLWSINAAAMVFVLVRTYRGSKFPFLYTCGGLMLLAAVLNLIQTILLNWYIGCVVFYGLNEKCHSKPSNDWAANVLLSWYICISLDGMFYVQAHFVFAYRYLESAEMLGSKK